MHGKFYIDDPDILKFGYFEVENFKSLSKYETWQFANNNNISLDKIHYNFNDDLFSKLDWTKEPTTNIDTLYKLRAELLREKYDYIVLMYSGGIDSDVVLNTFYNNSIQLDEIITVHNSKLPYTHKFNQEVYNSAIPYVKSLGLDNKHTLVDIGDFLSKQYSNQYHLDNFVYYVNGTFSSWTTGLRSGWFKLLQKKHTNLSQEGKKICYVWGYDKPTIKIRNGHYAWQFGDYSPDLCMKNFFSKYVYKKELLNFTDEGFFTCDDVPEIALKQGNLIASALSTMDVNNNLLSVSELPNTGPFIQYDHLKWLSKKMLEKIIYPNANHNKYSNDKVPGSIMYTVRDAWFFRSKNSIRNDYIAKVKELLRTSQDYFRYTPDGTPINSILITGDPYMIKKIKNE